MTIAGTGTYDAASALKISAFGHSTASPLATTRLTPAYVRPYDATGGWTATSATGVGAGFTALGAAAAWSGMTVGTTFDALAPDSSNAASG